MLNIAGCKLLEVSLLLVGDTGLSLGARHLLCGPYLLLNLLFWSLRAGRILSDRLMGALVQCLDIISRDTLLDVLGELPLVCFFIIIKKRSHVLSYVETVNVLTMDIGVEVLALGIIARETSVGVRNVKTSIDSSLHGTEDPRPVDVLARPTSR